MTSASIIPSLQQFARGPSKLGMRSFGSEPRMGTEVTAAFQSPCHPLGGSDSITFSLIFSSLELSAFILSGVR